jgi:hypothetical protein
MISVRRFDSPAFDGSVLHSLADRAQVPQLVAARAIRKLGDLSDADMRVLEQLFALSPVERRRLIAAQLARVE